MATTEAHWWTPTSVEETLARTMRHFHSLGAEESELCKHDPKRAVQVWKSLRQNVIQHLVEASAFDSAWIPPHMEAFHAGFYGNDFDLTLAAKKLDTEPLKPAVESPLSEDEPF